MARVMVIDDNEDGARALSQVVTTLGYRVQAVSDPREAVAVAAVFRPDVVFLDLDMPHLSGFEVCRLIKGSLSEMRPLPRVIAYTAARYEGVRDRIVDAGFDAFVQKPTSLDELLAVLRGETARLAPRRTRAG